MCGGKSLGGWTNENGAISNFLRFKEIKDYNKQVADVFKFIQGFPDVNWRYYVQPSSPFPGNALNADNTTVTWPVQMMGRLDGENVVKAGEGFYFDAMKRYQKSPELKKEYPEAKKYVDYLVTKETEKYKQERRHQNPLEADDVFPSYLQPHKNDEPSPQGDSEMFAKHNVAPFKEENV